MVQVHGLMDLPLPPLPSILTRVTIHTAPYNERRRTNKHACHGSATAVRPSLHFEFASSVRNIISRRVYASVFHFCVAFCAIQQRQNKQVPQ